MRYVADHCRKVANLCLLRRPGKATGPPFITAGPSLSDPKSWREASFPNYSPQGKVVATENTARPSLLKKSWGVPSDSLRSLPSIHFRDRLNFPAV